MSFTSVLAFVSCLSLSFVLTWTVRNIACKRQWAVPPTSKRHIHSKPIPRLGGVAIVLAFYVAVLATYVVAMLTGRGGSLPWGLLWRILGPAALVFLVGLIDDLRTIGPYQKFAGQAIAGSLLFLGGLRIVHVPILFGSYDFNYVVSLAATIFWVLWITNAFNLIDGVDGLAAGSALLSTCVIFVVAAFTHSGLTAFATAALAGGILGFLRYNFNPATIFLGDSGSLFIGFMLSALALQNAEKSSTMIAVAIPIVSFGLPVLETALSVGRRFVSGRPLFAPDREHIHHKLLALGFSQRQVVAILYAVTALCGAMSLLLLQPGARSIVTVLFVLAIGLWIFVQKLGYREFHELARLAQRTLEQKEVIVNNLAIRKVAEELSRVADWDAVIAALERALSQNAFDKVELRLSAPSFSTASRLGGVEELLWTWRRADEPGESQRHAAYQWSLSIALVNSDGKQRGTLSLYRADAQERLMVDVNVITNCGFASALADALEQAVPTLKEVAAGARSS